MPTYSWLKRWASWLARCITLRARSVKRSYIWGNPLHRAGPTALRRGRAVPTWRVPASIQPLACSRISPEGLEHNMDFAAGGSRPRSPVRSAVWMIGRAPDIQADISKGRPGRWRAGARRHGRGVRGRAFRSARQRGATRMLPEELAKTPGRGDVRRRRARPQRTDHDNVVRVLDVGESAGNHYLVMEPTAAPSPPPPPPTGRCGLRSRRRERQTAVWALGPGGGEVWQPLFSPEGRHLLTVNGNGTIYVLRLAGP